MAQASAGKSWEASEVDHPYRMSPAGKGAWLPPAA